MGKNNDLVIIVINTSLKKKNIRKCPKQDILEHLKS